MVTGNFKNILVVRTDRIGDVVLTIPALRALKAAYPQARLSVWVAATTRELVDGLPFVDEVIVEDKSRCCGGYFDLVGRLRSRHFDLVVNFHTKRRINLACFLAGIPHRLGYRNNKFGFLLNMPVEDRRHLGEKHEARYCLDLLQHLGVTSSDCTLQLPQRLQDDAWAEDFLRQRGLVGERIVLIHPNASCPTRLWPLESYAALTERLIRSGRVRVILVGGPDARPQARQILSRVPDEKVLDMTGQTTLLQLTALMRHSRLVISNDSGPVHLAAAFDVPVVCIFLRIQPGINPERWRPLGSKSIVLCNKEEEAIKLNRSGEVVSGNYGAIRVEEVLEQARPFLT